MKVHYPKLYNKAHLSLNVFTASKGSNNFILFIILVGWGWSFLSVAWPTGVHLVFFSFAPELVGYSAPRDLYRRAAYSNCESWFLIHQGVYRDLFVCSW